MLYLSFDIANRSLAFTLMFYDKQQLAEDLRSKSKDMIAIHESIENNVKVIACEVHDLTEGVKLRNSNKAKRTLVLKKLLTKIECMILELGESDYKVLLEYQMAVNKKANVIFNQIFYHFAERNPITVKPCYKNMISLNKDLEYRHFSEKYKNSYCANKAHSKANFVYFLESFGFSHFLKPIKKKNVDDAADSFMQILAYINYYSKERIFKESFSIKPAVKNLRIRLLY